MSGTTLGPAELDEADARLAETDAFLARAYPGETGERQPVHTVYVPGHRFAADTVRSWGDQALTALGEAGGAEALAVGLGLASELGEDSARLADRVTRKLSEEPIEDLRLDFEDGYGDGPDEDADVAAAARTLGELIADGSAPPFVGIRFKCFEEPTRRRGIRTLDLFLSTLLETGELPAGLRLTLPKVSTVSQVETMVAICERFEQAAGLDDGRLSFEIQVETPQLIMGADGLTTLAPALHAGAGRVSGLHYGTYDYSASLQIAAAYQSMDHPAADHAKQVMQLVAAGTGVQLSDGSTNVLPIGSPDHVREAWRLHARLVRRSLERGFYQGWDMHPAQLPTRYLANYAFYTEGFAAAAGRLAAYVGKPGVPTPAVMDEPATARALARYLHRGHLCGATDAAELTESTGLGPDALGALARPKSDTAVAPATDTLSATT